MATTKGSVRKPGRSNIGERNTAIATDGGKVTPDPVPVIDSVPMHPGADGMIRVVGRVDDNRFALVEVHPGHPGGQVQIIGTGEADVWPTSGVMQAIHEGRIRMKEQG